MNTDNKGNIIVILLVLAVLIFGGFYLFKDSLLVDSTPDVELTETENREEAVTEKTTTQTPQKTTTKTSTAKPSATSVLPVIDADGAYLVHYLSTGFQPSYIEVKQGTTVRFINKSDSAMRIFAADRTTAPYRELDQSKTVGKGGTYDFTFNAKGVWIYNNYNNQNHTASIGVR